MIRRGTHEGQGAQGRASSGPTNPASGLSFFLEAAWEADDGPVSLILDLPKEQAVRGAGKQSTPHAFNSRGLLGLWSLPFSLWGLGF